ncbi:MAG: Fur family transcriptional regulator [Beijerinckiaceae bacterium]|jgi:Fur family ferric uptake transcriptional regulator|nr:Fur family transcriptional regulator [Beijerinckiaceae bacterium]
MDDVKVRFDRYQADLRRAGIRMTNQRRIILQVLAEADDHPDANEVHRRAFAHDRTLSLSTVYRTLRLLEERGAIQRHAFDDGRSRFENADVAHHDHLIDIETGQVIEFHSERIEKLQAELARELGYEIVRHRLELYGRKLPGRS